MIKDCGTCSNKDALLYGAAEISAMNESMGTAVVNSRVGIDELNEHSDYETELEQKRRDLEVVASMEVDSFVDTYVGVFLKTRSLIRERSAEINETVCSNDSLTCVRSIKAAELLVDIVENLSQLTAPRAKE